MSLAVLCLFSFLAVDDPLTVHARLGDEALETGSTGELFVRYELAPGWSVPRNPLLPAAQPAGMLQLSAPDEIRLAGPEARELPDLLRQAFLDLPHERLIEEVEGSIRFDVVREPAPASAIEFNVLLYVVPDEGEDRRPRLFRRRYRVELRPAATALPVETKTGAWGRGDVLALGQTAPDFELPTPFGAPLTTGDLLGEGLVVLGTYRSCL